MKTKTNRKYDSKSVLIVFVNGFDNKKSRRLFPRRFVISNRFIGRLQACLFAPAGKDLLDNIIVLQRRVDSLWLSLKIFFLSSKENR